MVREEHKPISIELEIDGKIKKFVTPKRVPGPLLREAALISEEMETESFNIADLDSYMQFVCDAFGNKFNLAEFEEGSDARDILKIVYACALFVLGQVTIAAEMLTKNVDIADIDEKKS